MKTGQLVLIISTVIVLLVAVLWYQSPKDSLDALSTSGLNLETARIDNQNTNTMNPLAESDISYDENVNVVLHTNYGDIEIELFLTDTPVTAGNFLTLAEKGFYNEVKFHRVIEGFMIQGGDPNSKGDDEMTYGTGGPGYQIPDEFAPGLSNTVGTLSMANAGPNTGGSQFFINTADNTFLDGKHAVFGQVVNGMDIVTEIEKVETGFRDIPTEPVVIQSIEINK